MKRIGRAIVEWNKICAVLVAVCVLWTEAALAQPKGPLDGIPQLPLPMRPRKSFVISDFNEDVTAAQLATNDFGGNSGLVESNAGIGKLRWSKESQGAAGGSLRLEWDFSSQPSAGPFVGVFTSLFGLTDTKVSLDGSRTEPTRSTAFPGYWLDCENVFASKSAALWSGRSLDELRIDVKSLTREPITLRIELGDEAGTVAFRRHTIRGPQWQTLVLPLRSANFESPEHILERLLLGKPDLDWSCLSILSLVIERMHEGDGVHNPTKGGLLIDNLVLVDRDGLYPDIDSVRGRPEYSKTFLEHIRASSFLFFLDFASRDPRCGGMIQDRGSFADLMSVGGAGFQLSAYVIGAQRDYLTRAEAATRVLALLRLLHDGRQGPDRVGAVGHRGYFFHFLGIDGKRKQNFDFSATRDVDESLNTVELSVIDTALVLCGVVTAQQYFDQPSAVEREIRSLAEAIYARVDWHFMLDSGTNQFYLGWKPNEPRDDDSGRWGRFALPDAAGQGHYSSSFRGGRELPATLDYYTDEGLLVALLAIASPTPAHRVDPGVFFAMKREGSPFVRTFPGSLFTYQFASCWLDTRSLGYDRDPAGKARPIDYFQNTQRAIEACRKYAISNPHRRAGVGSLGFGFSACDGPFGDYFAEAAPVLALAESGQQRPLEVGTLTVYGAASCILHAPRETIAAIWECERLGLLHPRMGFADAYNLEISHAVTPAIDLSSDRVLRGNGAWINRTGFAIDHGPMVLLIDAFLEEHFVARLFMSHPGIARSLAQLFPEWKR